MRGNSADKRVLSYASAQGGAMREVLTVKEDLGGDPTEFEIRAAAQAASGQFAKAVESEQQALAMAKRLKWDLAPLNERLAHYQSAQPWYGNLLRL